MATAHSTTSFVVHPSCVRGQNRYRSCYQCLVRALRQWGYDVTDYRRHARRVYMRAHWNTRSRGVKRAYYHKTAVSKYSITVKEYHRLLNEQEGVCALCGHEETLRQHGRLQRLAVDHDHECGRTRGLLCFQCNQRLGVIEKVGKAWLRRVEAYLELHGSIFLARQRVYVTECQLAILELQDAVQQLKTVVSLHSTRSSVCLPPAVDC